MNETTILLHPAPGNPNIQPDFLATVEPVTLLPRDPSSSAWQPVSLSLPFEIVLDGYTREPWSSGKAGSSNNDNNNQQGEWQSGYLLSTDGRNRVQGFLKYLKDRKKAAISKFEPTATDALSSSGAGSAGTKALLVVPFDPPPVPSESLPDGVDQSQLIYVKYLKDEGFLKRQKMALLQQQKQQQQQKMQQQGIQQKQQKKLPARVPPQSSGNKARGGGGGFLGSLLGAQRRTENHLDTVRASRPNDAAVSESGAQATIASFRNRISSDLEKFHSDSTSFVTKIHIKLNELVQKVPPEEMDRVTMDVFKYIVHEQVEEVGEDKWVAAKEQGEFMDECIIAVYKEGHCPQEILEDLNKGDLPDEIKGQARHMAESQSKAMQRKDKKRDELILQQSVKSVAGGNGMATLNTNKRDRRTLEQIQRDTQGDGKRGRLE